MASASDLLHGSELLTGNGIPTFTVTQAPAEPGRAWVATAAGTARSCCVLVGDTALDLANLTGLVFDTWSETLPRPGQQAGTADEIAGVAFHTARPDARAPHAFLLAVPPDPARGWRAEDLHAAVCEALELAQVRGLDLIDLPELRGPLPPTIKGQGADFTPIFF